jgi:hypothetical protein
VHGLLRQFSSHSREHTRMQFACNAHCTTNAFESHATRTIKETITDHHEHLMQASASSSCATAYIDAAVSLRLAHYMSTCCMVGHMWTRMQLGKDIARLVGMHERKGVYVILAWYLFVPSKDPAREEDTALRPLDRAQCWTQMRPFPLRPAPGRGGHLETVAYGLGMLIIGNRPTCKRSTALRAQPPVHRSASSCPRPAAGPHSSNNWMR